VWAEPGARLSGSGLGPLDPLAFLAHDVHETAQNIKPKRGAI